MKLKITKKTDKLQKWQFKKITSKQVTYQNDNWNINPRYKINKKKQVCFEILKNWQETTDITSQKNYRNRNWTEISNQTNDKLLLHTSDCSCLMEWSIIYFLCVIVELWVHKPHHIMGHVTSYGLNSSCTISF